MTLFTNDENPYGENKLDKISRILDEPADLVSSIFGLNYVNSKWPQFSRTEFDFGPNEISFCVLCLAEAYHGCFHEQKWLQKCPIHGIKLEIQGIPYSSKPKSERYLAYLISLLDLKCPGWHVLPGKYRVNEDIYGCKLFYDYLSWL